MIALLVMTDGRRDCIERTIPVALQMLQGLSGRRVIHDDSGDADYQAWLTEAFPTFDIVWHPAGRQGFGGAIRNAWRYVGGHQGDRFVFHLEDDFIITRPVPLDDMVRVLDDNPSLVQLALRRQPWNSDERAAGGIVEQHPDAYEDRAGWLAHRLFFTTNPCLYRSELRLTGWPVGSNSEGVFTHQLLEDPAVRFGFWGPRGSGEWCEHIGNDRVGVGY